MRLAMKIALIGFSGFTSLGESFLRAANDLRIQNLWFDFNEAVRGPRLLRAVSWRLARRPPAFGRFSKRVVGKCLESRAEILIALGTTTLPQWAIQKLRASGTVCLGFASDDPWNSAMSGKWVFGALQAYDVVFTPRRSNIQDFHRIGCADVRYLPFAFDDDLFGGVVEKTSDPAPDVLFVGGADRDRVAFMAEFVRCGLRPCLVGGYWERFPETRAYAVGFRTPRELNVLTASAKVNLCLVRRVNRDGHVMRSFEIAGAGGCMLAEDTEEHREIFGADGEVVLYFRDASDAANRARWLLERPAERMRLAAAVRARVGTAKNTYRSRLMSMLDVATSMNARRNKVQAKAASR